MRRGEIKREGGRKEGRERERREGKKEGGGEGWREEIKEILKYIKREENRNMETVPERGREGGYTHKRVCVCL